MKFTADTLFSHFEQFFDDDGVVYIVSITKLNATQKGNHVFDVASKEMKVFFGI